MILEQFSEIQDLTPLEKLLLVGELWDDLAKHPSEIPVSPETIAELDRRIEAYERDPEGTSTTWADARERILKSRV